MQKEIAIRLFQNAKYGTTYAKGVRHQALFNATADIKNPKVKYVLDFYTYGFCCFCNLYCSANEIYLWEEIH